MKIFKIKYTLGLLILMIAVSCGEKKSKAEKEAPKKWYKGNLHTHSYWSDGDEFPEVILDWYKSKDYQFMALSDHNTMADDEKWITIREDSIYQKGFQNYLNTYGKDWVTHKIDSGRTMVKLKTYEEYSHKVEKECEFLVIKSEEITDKFEDKHIHMNATNIQKKIEPMGGTSVANVMQNNLDQVLKQREDTGVPMIPHINHPNFYYSISLDDMISLNGERFFEVYNGHQMVQNMGDSTHISTENMWDLINISYLENNKPLMFGLATDDSHHYHKKGKSWSNAGRGWVMVQTDTLTAEALVLALEAGDFYSSTGVKLKTLKNKNNSISVEIQPETGVTYEITFIGIKKGESEAKTLKVVNDTQAEFNLTEDILFARCKITSSKLQDNPIENLLYEMAWTQPIVPSK
ncbi:histidinol-phosphatase [Aurantibacter crassamenti]|uniref:PHP domain-containing protein n=1 Tax=Aurantibacter crassamenti TaxID=1837375 RepID=UPI00193A0B22|nr:histidinol-phosphatase [Aurantibacter crassamenti]MBM1105061.1 histidinol-phosphatase [Aurantibacter crassamenti]